MSDRSRKLVTLALNKQLAEKMCSYRAKKQDIVRNKDVDPEFTLETMTLNPKKKSEKRNMTENADKFVTENADKFVTEILKDIVEATLNIIEKYYLSEFTKEGKARKRKRYDTSVEQRKKQKREETIATTIVHY